MFTIYEMELFQNCSRCNFTNLATCSCKGFEKDTIRKVSLHRKQWCRFHLHISFLQHVTLKFRLNSMLLISLNLSVTCRRKEIWRWNMYHRFLCNETFQVVSFLTTIGRVAKLVKLHLEQFWKTSISPMVIATGLSTMYSDGLVLSGVGNKTIVAKSKSFLKH